MDLSVIIVNYNVKYFLEQCLLSVRKAAQDMAVEVWVVDNRSTDGSVEMVREKFPEVKLIANTENVGFGKANNQALALSSGKYVLFLNPDMVLPEDCFRQCIDYMEKHPDVGALGPRLVDGKGVFLPESKRGFPSPWVSFCKISGLSSLFKNSSVFNRYHLGYLPEHETNEIDILAGCFMLIPLHLLQQHGAFDEAFFMYGEDIDLSYRVQKAGYKVVYFADTTVIHYKGESTKKGSLNYVKMFYEAMSIFARKHFTGSKAGFYVMFIQVAIMLRAALAAVSRVLNWLRLPMLDAVTIMGGLWLIKNFWEHSVKAGIQYDTQLVTFAFVGYIIVWLFFLFLSGAYDKPIKYIRIVRGFAIGTLVILAIYGLLSEDLRFSRAIIVLGAIWGTIGSIAIRWLLARLGGGHIYFGDDKTPRLLIAGEPAQCQQVQELLHLAKVNRQVAGWINPSAQYASPHYVGGIHEVQELTHVFSANEIIFCEQPLSFKTIITEIETCGPELNYKILAHGTQSIIGSNSKNAAGDLYITDRHFNIQQSAARRNKRLTDLLISMLVLLAAPISWLYWKHAGKALGNALSVLLGTKTWIGYKNAQLPAIRPSVLPVYPLVPGYTLSETNQHKLEHEYAAYYDAWIDVQLIWKNRKMLDL